MKQGVPGAKTRACSVEGRGCEWHCHAPDGDSGHEGPALVSILGEGKGQRVRHVRVDCVVVPCAGVVVPWPCRAVGGICGARQNVTMSMGCKVAP
jgi:hypothetical protein